MPNSAWTETGAGIDLVPVTTPITDPEQQSPDYLTNSDKIALMAQYAAELATKTQLDTTASSLSVSSTAYDNAVAAISTNLIAAGAPSNWATTWPDGTTFGPVTGIKTSLGNWWSSVATQRWALEVSISAAQSAQAKIAAITTATGMAASESIIPNGGFSTGDATGWVETDGGIGPAATYGALPNGANGLTFPAGQYGLSSPCFQVTPGRKYKVIICAYSGSGTQNVYFRVFYKGVQAANITQANKDGSADFLSGGTIATASTVYTYDWTAPTGANFASIAIYNWGGAAPLYLQYVFLVPYVEAAYLDAGCVTAAAIAAGAITADMITTGTLDASAVTVTNLDASNITVGTLAASKVQFPDGSALTSSNRTKLTVSSPGSDQPIVSGSYNAVSGMSASVTIASAAEVVLVSLNMSAYYSSGPGDTLFVRLMVDGNIAASFSYAIMGISTNPSKYTLPTQSLVLTTGTHTIDVDVNSSGTGDFVDTTAALYTIHIY